MFRIRASVPPVHARPMGSPQLSRTERRQALFEFWVLHLVLGVLIGTTYLVHVPAGLSVRAWVFVVLGLISAVGTLALVPALAFWIAERCIRGARALGIVLASTGALFLVLLYVDTRLYHLLRYHFNGAVWNVVLTRGSEDAIHLGGSVWGPAFGVLAVLIALEYWLWTALVRRQPRRRERRRRLGLHMRPLLRPSLVCAAVLLAIAGVEKSIYAAADLTGDHEVRHAAQVLPAYPKLRVSQLLTRVEENGAPDFDGEATLNYPLAYPRMDPEGSRPNILVLVLDSWRRDQFDAEVTPHLAAFAEEGRVFHDHLASGNGTRYGLFGMLYGLHGSYWFPALAAGRPPVLLDVLSELGYEIDVFSSASMNFPEFRQTAWSDVLDRVHDEYPARHAYLRDHEVAAHYETWAAERVARPAAEQRPFFTFVLLDAPHQPYDAPGGPFHPAAEHLDYVELVHSASPELVERMFNRYRNAVHWADGAAARVLGALETTGMLENTLVIVTGDHGEEFQECGFWGHTSNFSPEQLLVPFVMRGPGIEPGAELRPTSHHDLPSTLLELLGADPADRASYSLGMSLFEPDVDRRRVAAGWSDIGLWTPHAILRVPLDPDEAHEIEARDRGWNLLQDQSGPVTREAAALEQLREECRRFLAR